jgi:NADH-quinone oxidoreductase subunit C
VRLVGAEDWPQAVEAAWQDGFRFFDWLGAEDLIGRKDALLVVLALRRLDRPADVLLLGTELDRTAARLDSIRGRYAGAAWHEREAAELFKIEFRGGQPGRLLLTSGFTGAPLRKDEVLAARTGVTWPGTKEPGESDLRPEPGMRPEPGEGRASTRSAPPARRRLVPPGVPDPAVWGDREVTDPDPEPAEVAESAGGGRSRRRRVDSQGDTPRAPRRGS